MTKKNLIILIILLTIIDLVAAGWYMSRRIEASGQSKNLFEQRDSTDYVVEADTVMAASQDDLFDELQHNVYYFIANNPSIPGDNSSRYTSIKHVKVRWPRKVNGDGELTALNKELIGRAFGNSHSQMKDARYVYLNTPSFNKPIGDDYKKLSSAPTIVPVYGNVSQVLVYPYMTSQRLLVMEIDKVEYNGNTTSENSYFIHYDRMRQRVLSRLDILVADMDKETKLLKTINKKIDELNSGRSDDRKLQHALNVPAEVCCTKKGVKFEFQHGSISSSPIEILVEYDKLEPFFTEEFKQLLKQNEDYKIYDESIKPEPINAATVSKAVSTPVVTPKKTKSKNYYNSNYNNANKKQVKPRYRSRRKYSGAKRRSGYHGYSGRRSWSRHQR
ncbi:MAG: hypothetical protein IJG42_07700 [Muribaculaceae bacterium]|nr:hypothetical protein [Muribaculaceae bacterium]